MSTKNKTVNTNTSQATTNIARDVIEVSILDETKESYKIYGSYVNNFRAIPSKYDGLKVVYKRILQAAYEICPTKDKKTKTANLSGTTAAKYHPHGTQSIEGAINEAVNFGLLIGQGQFGMHDLKGQDILPAAARYTEVYLHPKLKEMFDAVKNQIKTYKNELGNDEWEYVPTPFPLVFEMGTMGIGVGTTINVFPFLRDSIREAYKNNNPLLLDTGVEVVKKTPADTKSYEDNLKSIWTTGVGTITTYITPTTGQIDGRDAVIIKSPSRNLLIKDSKYIKDLIDADKICCKNIASGGESSYGYYIRPKARGVDFNDLKDKLEKCTYNKWKYELRFTDGEIVKDVSMKDAIDFTYNNYKSLLQEDINRKIAELEFDILIADNFRTVADKIIEFIKADKKVTNEAIAKELKLDIKIVDAISEYKISRLYDYDPKSKVVEYQDKIKELKNTNLDDFIYSVY